MDATAHGHMIASVPYKAADERRAEGKALREAVPRASQREGKPRKEDPLFLQIKEAKASVLEPYAGASAHANHGQRVVAGQRLMQSASDLFLGWGAGLSKRHFYVRQLRDMKTSAIIEDFDASDLRAYSRVCGWALARAHARSGDPAKIAGYLGSSKVFDDAMCDFAVAYADQAQRDHRAFVRAVRQGRVKAVVETS